MSLGRDNFWGWLCDIRNPGDESLIKVFYPFFDEQQCNAGFVGFLSSVLIFVFIVLIYSCIFLSFPVQIQFLYC